MKLLYRDAGKGLYVTGGETDLDEVQEIVEAIRETIHANKKYQRIVILSGCHGDNAGDLYKENSFYSEDKFNEGADPVPITSKNVTTKSKRMLSNEIHNDGVVRVLGWCYSHASVVNWDSVTANWDGFV